MEEGTKHRPSCGFNYKDMEINQSSEKKKKVLFIITKSNWGGAQRYVFDLATNLPQSEYETVVATSGSGVLVDKLRETGIKTLNLPSLQRDISFLKELRSAQEIATLIKSEKPDILHINSSKAGGLGALTGRLLSVPRIIFTAHGWAFNENRIFISRLILKFLHWLTVLMSHRTIAVSYAIKEQMNWPFTKHKISVVYNGRLQPTLQSRERSRLILSRYNKKLNVYLKDFWSVTVAELHPIKQHQIAIRAIQKLVAKKLPIRHLIIGSGELRDHLETLIDELGLSENVFLLGPVDEAAQFLKAADVFVLPSQSEALAYVLIEACQAGIPSVASRVGGLPEIITDQQEGLLVEPGNVDQLATALNKLVSDLNTRVSMSEKAAKKGFKFSLSRMIGGTIDVYTSTI